MFYRTLLALSFGIFAGIFTGLAPGIHVNLISLIVVGASQKLLRFFGLMDLCIFIVSMSITHVFLDSLPSIFLGAPEAETALGVLPGHRFLLRGNGYRAVQLTILGAFLSLVMSIALFPAMIVVIKFIYNWTSQYTGYLLMAIILFMIVRDNNKIWSIIVATLASALGLVVFSMPTLEDPLFLMLGGLFGISTLIMSLNENQALPAQQINSEIDVKLGIGIRSILSGFFSGFLTAFLPGLGASTAAVLAIQIAGKIGDIGFMLLMGAINMANFVVSIGTLYAIDKARNGTIAAIAEIAGSLEIIDIALLLCAAIVVGGMATWIACKVGKAFTSWIQKVNYRKLVVSVIAILTFLTFCFTDLIGLAVMIVATCIGMIPAIKKVARTHAMACLTVPVILYYLL